MRILVTGGAGYIGSHAVHAFLAAGHDVLVYDNLSRGRREAVGDAELLVADLTDTDALEKAFRRWCFDAVVHFAALISPEESMHNPLDYYHVNVGGTLSLMQCCLRHDVRRTIFSSTAAVYGESQADLIVETAPLEPINVYGQTKVIGEHIVRDLFKRPTDAYVIFRYYNVAGADGDNGLGPLPGSEHLIPCATQAALGKDKLTIYGTDYGTPDGTCIRDYIHVVDLADLHLIALEYLDKGGKSQTMNCGYGHGYSVREIVSRTQSVAKEVLDKSFEAEEGARRVGDPECLVADNTRVCKTLDWKARYDDIDAIIQSDLRWRQSEIYQSLPPPK